LYGDTYNRTRAQRIVKGSRLRMRVMLSRERCDPLSRFVERLPIRWVTTSRRHVR
jgi:hypothetical protein